MAETYELAVTVATLVNIPLLAFIALHIWKLEIKVAVIDERVARLSKGE